MDWITTVNGFIALLSGLLGLIGTGVATFIAIRNWIAKNKEKTLQEQWAIIMQAADAGMQAAEGSTLKGADAKAMAIDMVKGSCAAVGLDITPFLDQLSAYIDQCIAFHNELNAKNKSSK